MLSYNLYNLRRLVYNPNLQTLYLSPPPLRPRRSFSPPFLPVASRINLSVSRNPPCYSSLLPCPCLYLLVRPFASSHFIPFAGVVTTSSSLLCPTTPATARQLLHGDEPSITARQLPLRLVSPAISVQSRPSMGPWPQPVPALNRRRSHSTNPPRPWAGVRSFGTLQILLRLLRPLQALGASWCLSRPKELALELIRLTHNYHSQG